MYTSIEDLLQADAYPHVAADIQCVETHISWVLLTGDYAYKIKKPVRLPFLDFSTLERRHHFCHEELRLNKRLAPQLYLEVVDVYEVNGSRSFSQGDKIVDYAVKMHQFPSQDQLDHRLDANKLDSTVMKVSADYIYNYYSQALIEADCNFGEPKQIIDPVLENFAELAQLDISETETQALQSWSAQQSEKLRDVFSRRKHQGFVRQLHGDLHLSNMVCFDDQILAFDCLEFDPELINIDIISEISFLFMDLLSRNRTDLAYCFLNRFLENSGDYSGLALLTYYTVYRALVRAKVNLMLPQQESREKSVSVRSKYDRHMDLANSLIVRPQPAIIIMCGMAGSGKSTISSQLLCYLPAIRLRSDLERKRLHKLAPDANSQSEVNQGIYSARSTEILYQQLLYRTTELINHGYKVIVDAAFLQASHRQQFRQLARQLHTPFLILTCQTDADTLRDRVLQRSLRHDDPSEANINVLEFQLRHASLPEPSSGGSELFPIDTSAPQDAVQLAASVKQRLASQLLQ